MVRQSVEVFVMVAYFTKTTAKGTTDRERTCLEERSAGNAIAEPDRLVAEGEHGGKISLNPAAVNGDAGAV